MIVHVSLRRTHIELAKRKYQRLRVDMNHHARPRKVNAHRARRSRYTTKISARRPRPHR